MIIGQLVGRVSSLLEHQGFKKRPFATIARGLRWSAHCMLGIPAKAWFGKLGFVLYLPPKWKGGGSTAPFLFREEYEPELALLDVLLEPGAVVVDGGANTGVFTFTAAKLVGSAGRVFAFEPGEECFGALEKSVVLNGSQNVSLQMAALSENDGSQRLYHHFDAPNSYSLGPSDSQNVGHNVVKTVSLDSFLDGEGRSRLDLIKLDVEGAEELVLRGAPRSLARWKPAVLFEINPAALARLNLEVDGSWRLLEALGYVLFKIEGDGVLRKASVDGSFSNYVAAHPDSISSNLDGMRVSP